MMARQGRGNKKNKLAATLVGLLSSSLLLATPVSAETLVLGPAAATRDDERNMAATEADIPQQRLVRRGEAAAAQGGSRPQAVNRARSLGMMKMKNKQPPERPQQQSGLFVEGGLKYYHDDNYYNEMESSSSSSKGKGMKKKKKKMSSMGKGRSMGMGKGKGRGKSSGYYHQDDYYYYHHDDVPTQAPEVVATFVQTMGCYSDESCVYSHNRDFAPEYLLLDECTWQVTADAILVVDYFDLEDGFDFLRVNGVGFTGNGEGLDGTPVMAGQEIVFLSDFMNTATGFRVCLSNPV